MSDVVNVEIEVRHVGSFKSKPDIYPMKKVSIIRNLPHPDTGEIKVIDLELLQDFQGTCSFLVIGEVDLEAYEKLKSKENKEKN